MNLTSGVDECPRCRCTCPQTGHAPGKEPTSGVRSFAPRFTITNRITAALTTIERARSARPQLGARIGGAPWAHVDAMGHSGPALDSNRARYEAHLGSRSMRSRTKHSCKRFRPLPLGSR